MGLRHPYLARRIDDDITGLYNTKGELCVKTGYTWIYGGGAAGKGFSFAPNEADYFQRQCGWNNAGQFRALAANNQNCVMETSGLGRLKFGVYAAGAATDSIGSIDIVDLAGNTRKLMVQA